MNKGRKLLIRSEGSGWIERESSAFENEVHQQEIFAKNPAQIPGVEVECGTPAVCAVVQSCRAQVLSSVSLPPKSP